MFSTLIVPLDGTDQAEQALPYAIRIAEASGARVALVRTTLGPPPSGSDWERQQLAAVTEAERYLANVVGKLASRIPLVAYVRYGDPTRKLLEAVSELNADAIVMTTHARTGLDHFLHGSVAEALLKQSPVPVFLVHARSATGAPIAYDPRATRVLVPLDGSPFSETALPVALQLLGTGGELILASVAAPPDHVELDDFNRPRALLDEQEERVKREAFDHLRQMVRSLRQTNPEVQVTVDVRVGDPAPGIVMAEMDRGVDLVVMSTHGRTGLGRAIMGSVAGEVLRTGNAPVVLVGPSAAVPQIRASSTSPVTA